MARLTTMWHLILGVPSTRDWSAYESAEQIDNGVTEVWPRARRLLYKRAQASRQAGLITADKQLNGGANEQAIRNIFVARGILPNPKRRNRRAGVPFSGVMPRPR